MNFCTSELHYFYINSFIFKRQKITTTSTPTVILCICFTVSQKVIYKLTSCCLKSNNFYDMICDVCCNGNTSSDSFTVEVQCCVAVQSELPVTIVWLYLLCSVVLTCSIMYCNSTEQHVLEKNVNKWLSTSGKVLYLCSFQLLKMLKVQRQMQIITWVTCPTCRYLFNTHLSM